MKIVLVAVFLVVLTTQPAVGRYLSRQKRVSDQRLAEIETLLALSKYKGLLSTVPVGYNRIDPSVVGRRRRASPLLWRDLVGNSEDELNDESSSMEDVESALNEDKPASSQYRLVSERRRGFEDSPPVWHTRRGPPTNNI